MAKDDEDLEDENENSEMNDEDKEKLEEEPEQEDAIEESKDAEEELEEEAGEDNSDDEDDENGNNDKKPKNNNENNKTDEKGIINTEISEEVKKSYLDYAMSVIVSRALPSIEDGLKPVQRRILYSMNLLGLQSNKQTKKSARIVGDVLGKYHPHGDVAVYEALVRMAQKFSLRYPLVFGQGNFGCFTADTKVKLVDRRNLSFAELIDENKEGKRNFTFTMDNGEIKIAEIKNPRKTRENAEIMKIILDNGEEIKCTLNHKFMLKDGSYKEAKDLTSGDSLMPAYFRLSNKDDDANAIGYEMIFQPKSDSWDFSHILSDEWNIENNIYSKSLGRIRHHLDFNKLNNNPNNIRRMNWKEHWRTHYDFISQKHKTDANYRKKLSEGRDKFWDNSDNRESYSKRMSERNLKNWKKEDYRQQMTITLSQINKKFLKEHPEKIEEISKRATITMKRLWQVPEYKQLFHEKIVASNKKRETNLTGKKKFLNICNYLKENNLELNQENFERIRKDIFGTKSFTGWNLGIKKYFNNDKNLILCEINGNHKVVAIEFLNEFADVYDLTIDKTHNFALASGVFVHNSVDGDPAAAMRYCIAGDSLIVTERGLEEIDKVSSNEEINLKVLSKDKKIHNASKWFDSGQHETIKIITDKGYSLAGSKNHPILMLSKDNFGKPIFIWKLLEEIKEGDIAVIDRREDTFWPENEVDLREYWPERRDGHQHIKILPQSLNEDLSFILGTLISEGSVSQNKIEFCNTDGKFIQEFEDKWKKIFPDSKLHKFKRLPSSYGKKEYFRLECHSRYTLEFLRDIGLLPVKADRKSIPKDILKSPKNVTASFLRAYFEGDGSISYSRKMNELSCCSKSKRLLSEIQVLLLRFGIDSIQRFDRYKDINKLLLRGKRNLLRFYKEINFFSERKRKKLEFVLINYKKEAILKDFVPFLSDFIRGMARYSDNEFAMKHNFDRYPEMKQNYQRISSVLLKKTSMNYLPLFEYLLTYEYLFDSVVKVEDNGVHRVYSIKVDSDCHSFISNGFISHNTEAKLSPISTEIIEDIDKETVKFVPNFDNSMKEPELMPSKLPNLIINGASGIAVGMATNIPPHNLSEICDAIVEYIKNESVSIDELCQIVTGPDFPTGGALSGDIVDLYKTGRGRLILRGKITSEESKGKERIVITEIPYMLNKSTLVEQIAALVQNKKLIGISDLRDESSKGKIRIVLELKKGVNSKYINNTLYKYTRLQDSFNANFLALVGAQPRILNLKQIIEEYVKYRKHVVTSRTAYELKKAKERLEIVEGLLIALKHIDEIIAIIKKSREEAAENLIKKFNFTKRQAEAILETKLRQLTALEQDKLKEENEKLKINIIEYEKILGDIKEVLKIITKEVKSLKEKYGDERKTQVMRRIGEIAEKDLVQKKDVIVTITEKGYCKRIDSNTYKEQRRGGRGVIGSDLATGDFVKKIISCSTHDYLMFFTSRGRVLFLKVYEIPEADRYSKGKALINLIELKEESITNIIAIKEFNDSLFMVTKKGFVKKSSLSHFSKPRAGGIRAINLPADNSDVLIDCQIIKPGEEVLLATKKGQAIRFNSNDVRLMGRASYGVTGVRMEKDDEVVSLEILRTKEVLTITKHGYGKRTAVEDYRKTSRGGKGVINVKVSEKTGDVVTTVSINGDDKIIITTGKGMVIRTNLDNIRVMGRATQGVRIVKLQEGDYVTDLVRVENGEGEE